MAIRLALGGAVVASINWSRFYLLQEKAEYMGRLDRKVYGLAIEIAIYARQPKASKGQEKDLPRKDREA
jgi:hypothetical protein